MNKPPNYWTNQRVHDEAARFPTRVKFAAESAGAYCAARKLGILDDVCAHMVSGRIKGSKWNKSNIQKIINNCNSLKEFRTKHRGAYKAILKFGWQDLLKNLARSSAPLGYWSSERIQDEANKYMTRSEFMKSVPGAYHKAHRMGILDKVCSHMEYIGRPNHFWTKENIFNSAKLYKSRTEFLELEAGAYAAATRLGILDDACSHMRIKGNRYSRAIYAFEFDDRSVYVGLTFDYQTRYREHLSGHGNATVAKKLEHHDAYFVTFNEWHDLEAAAKAEVETIKDYKRRGWKILNQHKAGGVGSYPRIWTKESCLELALVYDTVKEFRAEQSSAYIIASRKGWWHEISKHLTKAVDHGKWTLDALISESKKYHSRRDFEKMNPGAYSAARKKGLLDQVCSHMMRLVNPPGHWTKRRVTKEAKKYSTRTAFQKGSKTAYQKAFRMGWLDDVCAHMKSRYKPVGYWLLYENVEKEAKKYDSRSNFQRGASAAYGSARKNGWLSAVCAHM